MVQLLEEMPAQREQGPDADDAEEDPEIFSQAKRQKVRGSSTWRWLRLCDERPRNATTGQAAECEWQRGMGAALCGEEWQPHLLSCEKWFASGPTNAQAATCLGWERDWWMGAWAEGQKVSVHGICRGMAVHVGG